MRVCVQRANTYDWVNNVVWTEEIVKEAVRQIQQMPDRGYDFVFDETDKCVYATNPVPYIR